MAMALTTVPESIWFEFDERYADEMAEKRQLLHERHRDVFLLCRSPMPRARKRCKASSPI